MDIDKYYSQTSNINIQSKYNTYDIKKLYNNIIIEFNNIYPDILLSILGYVNLNKTMKYIDILNSYKFIKEITLNTNNKFGYGIINDDIHLFILFGYENRINTMYNINNIKNINTFINENNIIFSINKIKKIFNFKNLNKVIFLSQGNNYLITEILINDFFNNHNNIISYCFNPGRILINSFYISITKFYLYKNPISIYIPSEIIINKNTKIYLYYPFETNYITFTSINIPINDLDKFLPLYYIINNSNKEAEINTIKNCKNCFDFDNINLIDKFKIYDDKLENIFCDDLVNLIIKAIINSSLKDFTIYSSINKNIIIIKDINDNILIFCNKTILYPKITGKVIPLTTNNITYDIDESYNTDNINNEINNFNNIKTLLNNANQVIILGINFEIHFYLNKLLSLRTNFNNKYYLYVLGLSSITKNFNNFNVLGFKDSKIINIFNDLVILHTSKNNYDEYDNIKCDILYDISVESQLCLNTIFGYANYINH